MNKCRTVADASATSFDKGCLKVRRRAMELIKIKLVFLVYCGVWWADGAAVSDAADGEFSAAAARLLSDLRLPPARAALAPAVLTDVGNILQSYFPGCEVELFGSIATGLAIATSDVDVSVTFLNRTIVSSTELVLDARDIMLQHPDLFEVIRMAPRARTPILTVRHLPTGFNVDISFNHYNGVMNSKFVQYIMSLDDRAKDLAQILKHWAGLHNVTGHSMLPSYGIVTMAIFFLQRKEILPTVVSLQRNAHNFMVDGWNMGFTKDKYETKNDESLCQILGGFFEFYSEFDYKKYMVSPFIGRPVEIDLFKDLDTVPEEYELYITNVRSNTTRPMSLKIPIVQDSFEHNNNLAYRLKDISKVSMFVTSFQYAARRFREGCSGFLQAILTKQAAPVQRNSASDRPRISMRNVDTYLPQ